MNLNFDIIRSEVKDVVRQGLQNKSAAPIEVKLKTYNRTDVDVKAPTDQVFRDVLLELIEREENIRMLEDLVTMSIECCRKGLCSLSMPVVLLADIFDLLTLDLAEKMFAYVERQVNVWKEDLFFTSCKNNLLRMCNDLLRKLSKSSMTVFCGRILLFLAKFFPFSERSGLNIVSEFNLENVTEYGSENLDESPKEKEEKSKGIYIDYSLYCKFWSLQDFFRNPNQCYNKVQWKLFCSHASSIISTFQGLKLEQVDKPASWLTSDDDDNDLQPDRKQYFSKYLTNQKLLDLQLYDVNFRRFVLLQFLILFQYLTTTVRFKTETYELKPDQKEWIQSMMDKVYGLLKETPPDGDNFARIVTNILNREEYWNAWKNDGCPEFKRVLPTSTDPPEKKKPDKPQYLGDVMKEAQKNGIFYMGNPELTKLWNLYPDNLEACKAKERDFLPTLENYFAEAIEQLDGLEPGQESNLLKDGNFGWRALRLLARRSPHFFTHSNKPISELHSYLEVMVRRIAADKPGTSQESTEQNDEIEEDLFKQPEETAEDLKNNDAEVDERYIMFRVTMLLKTQFDQFCERLAHSWKVLAVKLGYKSDEIEYIASQDTVPVDQARRLLNLWFGEDDDSTLENFLYILEGLQLNDVAEEVKLAIEHNKTAIIS